jgi:hypothetical protein
MAYFFSGADPKVFPATIHRPFEGTQDKSLSQTCEGPPGNRRAFKVYCTQPAYAVTVRVGFDPHSP